MRLPISPRLSAVEMGGAEQGRWFPFTNVVQLHMLGLEA